MKLTDFAVKTVFYRQERQEGQERQKLNGSGLSNCLIFDNFAGNSTFRLFAVLAFLAIKIPLYPRTEILNSNLKATFRNGVNFVSIDRERNQIELPAGLKSIRTIYLIRMLTEFDAMPSTMHLMLISPRPRRLRSSLIFN